MGQVGRQVAAVGCRGQHVGGIVALGVRPHDDHRDTGEARFAVIDRCRGRGIDIEPDGVTEGGDTVVAEVLIQVLGSGRREGHPAGMERPEPVGVGGGRQARWQGVRIDGHLEATQGQAFEPVDAIDTRRRGEHQIVAATGDPVGAEPGGGDRHAGEAHLAAVLGAVVIDVEPDAVSEGARAGEGEVLIEVVGIGAVEGGRRHVRGQDGVVVIRRVVDACGRSRSSTWTT